MVSHIASIWCTLFKVSLLWVPRRNDGVVRLFSQHPGDLTPSLSYSDILKMLLGSHVGSNCMYFCCSVVLLSNSFVLTHSSWSMIATCGRKMEFRTSRRTAHCQTCVMVMFHSYHCVAVRMRCGTVLLLSAKTPSLWVNNPVTWHYSWLVTLHRLSIPC